MKRVFAAALTAAAFLTPAASAQTVVAEKLSVNRVPSRTYMHVSVPNVEAFRSRFRETDGAGLFSGPEMASLRDRFMEQYEKADEKVRDQLGASLSDLLNVATDEFAMAVTEPDGEDAVLSFVMFVGFGENSETVDLLTGKIRDAYKSQGGEVETTDVDGVEIVNCFKEDADGPDPEKFSFNYFIADGMWVIGTNRTALESVIERWDGDNDDTLLQDDDFQDMMERVDLGLDRAPAIGAFLDPIGLLQSVGQTAGQVDPQAGQGVNMALGFLPLTGLQGLRSILSVSDFGDMDDDVQGLSKTFVKIDRPSTALLKVFELTEGEQTPPEWVSADVAAYQSFTWAVDDAYKAVEGLLDQFQGRGATQRQLDDLRDAPGGPGLHIKDDVLDQMEGTIRSLSIPAKGTKTSDLTPQDLAKLGGSQVFAIRLKRTHNMGEVIAKLAENQPGQLESRDFRGTTIYEFEADSDDGAAVVGGVAVANEHLIIATDVTSLENIIRGGGEGLAETDAYKKATDGFPSEAAAVSFNNGAAQLENIYELARNGAFDDMIRDAADDSDEVSADDVLGILRDLPAFADIKKYFGYNGSYTTVEDDGLLMMGRAVSR